MNPGRLIIRHLLVLQAILKKPYYLVDYTVFCVDFSCLFSPAMTLFRRHTASRYSALQG
jgi:hypothetical protein